MKTSIRAAPLLALFLLVVVPAAVFGQTPTITAPPATATSTRTNTPQPTPDLANRDAIIRAFDKGSFPPNRPFKLGTLLRCLFSSRQQGGAMTVDTDVADFDVAPGKYTVHGVYVAGAAGDSLNVPAGCTTGAGQFRKCTVCIDQAGAYRVTAGIVAASQAAASKPACLEAETEVAYFEFGVGYDADSDTLSLSNMKQADSCESEIRF